MYKYIKSIFYVEILNSEYRIKKACRHFFVYNIFRPFLLKWIIALKSNEILNYWIYFYLKLYISVACLKWFRFIEFLLYKNIFFVSFLR